MKGMDRKIKEVLNRLANLSPKRIKNIYLVWQAVIVLTFLPYVFRGLMTGLLILDHVQIVGLTTFPILLSSENLIHSCGVWAIVVLLSSLIWDVLRTFERLANQKELSVSDLKLISAINYLLGLAFKTGLVCYMWPFLTAGGTDWELSFVLAVLSYAGYRVSKNYWFPRGEIQKGK